MADRKEALETAIKQLEKQYGKGTVMKHLMNTFGNQYALSVSAIRTFTWLLMPSTSVTNFACED